MVQPLESVDAVVVGAGLAGLSAARQLQREGRSVLVLEARERVGGRTLNHQLGDDKVAEVGGQYVGPTQDHVLALARELGVDTFPTYDQGRSVFEVDGKRLVYRGAPLVNPLGLADAGRALFALDRLSRRVRLEEPWGSPGADRLDSQTLEGWRRRNVHSRLGRVTLDMVVESTFACEPAEISLLHFLFIVRSAGGLRPIAGVRGGAQQDRLVGGSQLISIRTAQQLGSGTLRLGAAVRRIEHSAGKVVADTGQLRVEARHAVVAVPPVLAGRIDYDPPLPAFRDQITQRAPMGSVIKTLAVYDEPFWRADGLNGQAAGNGPGVRATFDNSPPDGRPGVLLGFVEAGEARRLGRESPQSRREQVLASFARYFGPRAARPADYVELDWAAEEWTRGCYFANFGPGVWTQHGPALRAPVGPLHWAGTETATEWSGYMDGAVQSGGRAAREILEGA